MGFRAILTAVWLLFLFRRTTSLSIANPGQYCRVLPVVFTCVCRGIELPDHDVVSFELGADYPLKCSNIVLQDSNLKHMPTNLVQIGEAANVLLAINSHLKAIQLADFTAPECIFVNLNFNDIEVLPARVFSNMPRLYKLTLTNNKLNLLHRTCFEGLSRLQVLHLQHNDIEELDLDVFKSLPNLTELLLGHNRIRVIKEDAFLHNPNIQELSLEYNNLKIVDVNILTCPKALKFLPTFINQSTTNPTFLGRLPNLQLLNMTANFIALISQDTFARNQKLRWVDLTAANISCLADGAFENNNGLTHLYLGGNNIGGIDVLQFEAIRNLEYLNLRHNNLLELKNYHRFEPPPSLKGLFLKFNSFNCTHLGDVFESFKNNRLLDVHPSRVDEDCFDVDYSDKCQNTDDLMDDPCQEIEYSF